MTSGRYPTCIDFLPHDRLIASGHKDGRIRFWDHRTGKKNTNEIKIGEEGCQLTKVKCNNMGCYLVTTSSDSVISKVDFRMMDKAVW